MKKVTTSCHFSTLLFVLINQMRHKVLISEFKKCWWVDFFTFGQSPVSSQSLY